MSNAAQTTQKKERRDGRRRGRREFQRLEIFDVTLKSIWKTKANASGGFSIYISPRKCIYYPYLAALCAAVCASCFLSSNFFLRFAIFLAGSGRRRRNCVS